MNANDLQKFCGRETSRAYLMKPFTHGAYSWATDGHIIIRVPRIDGVAETSGPPIDDALATVMATKSGPLNTPLPSYDIPPRKIKNVSVGICGMPFAARYVRMLQALPNVIIRAMDDLNDAPHMVFSFDGGDGALMGLRYKLSTHIEPKI